MRKLIIPFYLASSRSRHVGTTHTQALLKKDSAILSDLPANRQSHTIFCNPFYLFSTNENKTSNFIIAAIIITYMIIASLLIVTGYILFAN